MRMMENMEIKMHDGKLEARERENRVLSEVQYNVIAHAANGKINAITLKIEKTIKEAQKNIVLYELWNIRKLGAFTLVNKRVGNGNSSAVIDISVLLREKDLGLLFSNIDELKYVIEKWGVKYAVRVMLEIVKAVTEAFLSPSL